MNAFKYTPIDRERPSFRQVLLRRGIGVDIECDLISSSFDDEFLPYEAVSYAWGSPEETMLVKVDGKPKRITTNLHAVLLNLRHPDADRLLWVDAICINQKDNREKTHQVQRMGQIYKQAERVLVYLGHPTENTYFLMSALAKFEERTRGRKWAVSDDRWTKEWQVVQDDLKPWHAQQCLGLRELLSRPWFHRVWVLQEVAHARFASVYCGSRYVSTRVFALAPRLLGETVEDHCQAVLDLMPGPSRQSSFWNHKRDLLTLMRKFKDAEASDERDKIYALLEMCVDSNVTGTLTPDYAKPLKEVIHDTLLSLYALPQSCRFVPPGIAMSDFYAEGDRVTNLMFKEAVALSSVEVMEILLQQRSEDIIISEQVLETIVTREGSGVEMMAIILRYTSSSTGHDGHEASVTSSKENSQHQGKKIRVTSRVIISAMDNVRSGRQILSMLLQQPVGRIELDSDTVTSIVFGLDDSSLDLFFCHYDRPVEIGKELLELAERNATVGRRGIEALLRQPSEKAEVTPDAITYIVTHFELSMVQLLFDHHACRVSIDEALFEAAASNEVDGVRVVRFLLEQGRDRAFAFTTSIFEAICQNQTMGFGVMEIMLQQPGTLWTVQESTVDAISWNPSLGSRAVQWLLLRPRAQVQITGSAMRQLQRLFDEMVAECLSQGEKLPLWT